MPSQAPKTNKHPTLKQVAELAGVSLMTVSNFMNGRHQRMSVKVRDRVERAVKQLNYRRNHAAHNLRTSRLLSIGMIIVDSSDSYLADGYTTQIVSGVSNHLTEKGFSLLLQGIRPAKFENSSLIRDLRTDGLVAMLSGNDSERKSQFQLLRKLNVPLVIYMESFKYRGNNVCFIRQDEHEAGYKLGMHILKRKPKNALILIHGHNIWAGEVERVQGMKDALKSKISGHNITTLDCMDGYFENVQQVLKSYFKSASIPDVILCANDQIAIASLKLIQTLGLKIPEDIQITGFNAFELHRYSDPELTTIKSPAYDMGTRGAQEIVQHLHSGQFTEKNIIFPYELILGNSS